MNGKCNSWRVRDHVLAFAGVALSVVCAADETSASSCQLVKIAEWPVRIERNKMIVDGALDGQKIGVMLDTGAARSGILRAAAMRMGLALKPTGGAMIGIGGETSIDAALVGEFKVGDFVRKHWAVAAIGEHDADGYGFILGEDFFHQVDVEFDLAHKAVRLFTAKGCGSASLAYWGPEGASDVVLEGTTDHYPRILLEVRINGMPMQAQLDSGASTSTVNTADARRAGVTPETPGVVAVGSFGGLGEKAVNVWNGPFASFAVGNETIKDTMLRFADLWKDGAYTRSGVYVSRRIIDAPAMLLGADFFLSHRVLVAHSQRRMYFTYVGGPVFAPVARPAPSAARAPAAATTSVPSVDKDADAKPGM